MYAVDAIVRDYKDQAQAQSQEVGPDAPAGTFAAGVYHISELIVKMFENIFEEPVSDSIKVCLFCILFN